jgi:hypothetical protein
MTRSLWMTLAMGGVLVGCSVGEPLIIIEAHGNEFRFRSSRDGRAPSLTHINVNAVDDQWRAVDPVVCLVGHRVGSEGGGVASWTYGSEPPSMQIRKCEPLAPQSWYRIGVGGAGGGTALFSTDARGRITIRERP